ncbi:MAG: hypothetical protein A2268_12765 [Candidatus Raymondbacteria bacterium RifOxyA12_full_50_37]|uniref:Uncharacterized protein n=1 Tax=Candidatus Raymondbacteria bacterium RIFOXYD12_FULL_49_13 TaxID=1817890 RepID=A0A1F7F3X1_UNCRA|nr:MAG: hypothetical protein A2268_12765 [Candidatus Raymondbacteria bacterium RifOxyA12_full_50_37]OGJ90792.1 MAG: hypothetical protein A2248_02225 [Candidatus Raymondbacteria bacterium RIFOXYA2_FULL_49_16]OGJ96325.1 MAG: hypothetical protein A2350_03705 [Candidatus Raymondbacteria bacterium RifOxyB12_full_50_8]OGJ96969.1 MAG: hypothetical protein A2487_06060 [Candidatus Raymondbacteria bacterium RifOxyC12_full_50_8]OGJ97359.1 MAG: hypothetical protein A2453_03505 [Candidatus Raymondbacteria b
MYKNRRRPIRNLIFHPDIQIPFIRGVLFLVAIVTAGATIAAAFIGVSFTALVAIETAVVALAFLFALRLSHRVAVPLYRIERWSQAIQEKNFNVHVALREQWLHKDLMDSLNLTGEELRRLMKQIEDIVNDDTIPSQEAIVRVREKLKEYKYE